MFPYFLLVCYAAAAQANILLADDSDEYKSNFLIDIIGCNLENNGWNTLIAVGDLPDSFYIKAQKFNFPLISLKEYMDKEVFEIYHYRFNTVVISCTDSLDFESKFTIVRSAPHWHPHSHTIIYSQKLLPDAKIAEIFFLLWFYQCCNAIFIQHNDADKYFYVKTYNTFINTQNVQGGEFGCWTRNVLPTPISSIQNGIECTEGCLNVTHFRHNYLGTCLGLKTIKLKHQDREGILRENLFEDKGKNLNGYNLRAYVIEGMPFLVIDKNPDGTTTLRARDGVMWETLAKKLNFAIDVSPSSNDLTDSLNFELTIKQIFEFSQRKVDLLLAPVYQFDFVIIEVDYTTAFKESGRCFITKLAGFETILFDVKLIQENVDMFIEFTLCFLGSWFVFFVFNAVEKNRINFDQAGKDLTNAIRSTLSLSLYKPPRKGSFRIYLFISMWGYFIINFTALAGIISFFSAFQRGAVVNTFDELYNLEYNIEVIASPDVMQPESEERYKKIKTRIVTITHQLGCINQMRNDSRRICLLDCSMANYFARNWLNNKGEPYLHVAAEKLHNYYLNIVLPKNSVLTREINKLMFKFIEAGLIQKWEQYLYKNIKYEVPVTGLSLNNLWGIFKCYFLLVGITVIIFVLEILFHAVKRYILQSRVVY